jgi:hypothetical protein
MADCEKYQELISLYVDRGISDEEKAELIAHIEQCEDCAQLLSIYADVSRLAAEDVEPPEELCAGVMAGVRKINAEKSKSRTSKRAVSRWIAAAACIAILAIPAAKLLSDNGANFSGSAPQSAETASITTGADGSSEAAIEYSDAESEYISDDADADNALSGTTTESASDILPDSDHDAAKSPATSGSTALFVSDVESDYFAVVYADTLPEDISSDSSRIEYTFSDGTMGATISRKEFESLEEAGYCEIIYNDNATSDVALLVFNK